MGRKKQRTFATYKRRGEWVELLFMTLAAERGFNVARPWGDSARYDVSIEREARFLRVQVKSASHWIRCAYVCPLHGYGHRQYKAGELDYFAIYVVPAEVWYIFPAKRLLGLSAVSLTPDRKGYKYERYKQAWWLLLREHKRRGKRTIVPDEEVDRIPSVEKRSDRRVQ